MSKFNVFRRVTVAKVRGCIDYFLIIIPVHKFVIGQANSDRGIKAEKRFELRLDLQTRLHQQHPRQGADKAIRCLSV